MSLDNFNSIKEKIDKAAQSVNRQTREIDFQIVTKTRDTKEIIPLLEAGHRIFGENRVQEALDKWPDLKKKYTDITLHLIGPLQSNKAELAVQHFDVIETVDRPKLVDVLAKLKATHQLPALYIQVNTGEEDQKSGINPRDFDDFYAYCQEKGLEISGLMCIPPADKNPAPHFALLTKIGTRYGITNLSMGMSQDYEMAIQLGATKIRVGREVFTHN